VNLTAFFRESGFQVFKKMCADGLSVKGIQVPKAAGESRAFFDKLTNWVKDQGAPGLAYVLYGADGPKGPLGKALLEAEHQKLRQLMDAPEGAGIFFLAGEPEATTHLAGNLRQKLGEAFNCIEKDVFRFCWITDFPMYEKDPQTGQIMFSHNPFSMPQGGLEALTLQDPLSIKAYQYDIVCNGIELSSGAIRNHLPDVMVKAFEIAGYDRAHLEENFGALFRAFSYGVPPHGGAAPGVDRMIMLLTGAENLRETIAFPLNQQAQDRLMGAPHPVSKSHLQELGLSVADKPPSPK
jgi:aspartyl-tRNA synthetase